MVPPTARTSPLSPAVSPPLVSVTIQSATVVTPQDGKLQVAKWVRDLMSQDEDNPVMQVDDNPVMQVEDNPVMQVEDNHIETESPREFNVWPYFQTAVKQLGDQGNCPESRALYCCSPLGSCP